MATTSPRTRRTSEDWEALARELQPELAEGATIDDFRDRIGSNGDALRTHLALLGFDPHGQEFKLKPITAKTDQTLAKRVARRRRDGAPWWLVIAETGVSYNKLIRMLHEYGWTVDGEQASTNGASA